MKSKPIHGTRGVPVAIKGDGFKNAARQRQAVAKLSELELATGRSPEWWEAHHAAQRARVLKRYGVTT